MWHRITAASCSTSRSCSHVVVVVAAVVVVAPLLRDTSITPHIRVSSERGVSSAAHVNSRLCNNTTQSQTFQFYYLLSEHNYTLFIRRNATNVADTTTASYRSSRFGRCVNTSAVFVALHCIQCVCCLLSCVHYVEWKPRFNV